MKTVLVLGKGSLAIKICTWFFESPEHELIGIVPVVPEPDWTDSLMDWARMNSIPLVETGDFNDERARPDLAFSVYYDRIISRDFIDRCDSILNIHNAPLPKYRGVSPINWALLEDQKEHGVTIHEITPGIADGPIGGTGRPAATDVLWHFSSNRPNLQATCQFTIPGMFLVYSAIFGLRFARRSRIPTSSDVVYDCLAAQRKKR